MKKASKKFSFSLSDIGDIIELKLGMFSDKIDARLAPTEARLTKKIDDSETGIISEMNTRFEEVSKRFDEVDKRFDANDDAHQELLSAIEETTKRKISEHVAQKHSFATA